MKGSVKWFNNQKGYGFIATEDGAEYFVHYFEIDAPDGGFRTLKEGSQVEFETKQTDRGVAAAHVKQV